MVLPGYSEWPTLLHLDAQRAHSVAIRDDIVAHSVGATGMPRPGSTWAAGSAASRGPGSLSLDPRIPDPMITEPVLATVSSTRTGQSAGRPTEIGRASCRERV